MCTALHTVSAVLLRRHCGETAVYADYAAKPNAASVPVGTEAASQADDGDIALNLRASGFEGFQFIEQPGEDAHRRFNRRRCRHINAGLFEEINR